MVNAENREMPLVRCVLDSPLLKYHPERQQSAVMDEESRRICIFRGICSAV